MKKIFPADAQSSVLGLPEFPWEDGLEVLTHIGSFQGKIVEEGIEWTWTNTKGNEIIPLLIEGSKVFKPVSLYEAFWELARHKEELLSEVTQLNNFMQMRYTM